MCNFLKLVTDKGELFHILSLIYFGPAGVAGSRSFFSYFYSLILPQFHTILFSLQDNE